MSKSGNNDSTWHVLDAGSIWMKEFSAALSRIVPTNIWCPEIRNTGHFEEWTRPKAVADPPIQVNYFPMQRGYARFPISNILPFEKAIVERLKKASANPEKCTLICTTPFYAPVAERWPGPVVYYSTDLTREYAGMNRKQVISLDKRLCSVATAVCPNSVRISDYFCHEAGCDPRKVTVIPQATREQNILDHPLFAPIALPSDLADLPRPVIGVIGNLAGNMDWSLIASAISKTPNVSWAFVGPTDMEVVDPAQAKLRSELLSRGGRVRFVGSKPYGELSRYARSLDVALMPYRKHEPTFSGSATRFYEHLAACRPILASRGFHELLSKEPLLTLIDTGDDVSAAVEHLRSNRFSDGIEEARWQASRAGTWSVRARDLVAATIRMTHSKVA